jgi:hypothetical protein
MAVNMLMMTMTIISSANVTPRIFLAILDFPNTAFISY